MFVETGFLELTGQSAYLAESVRASFSVRSCLKNKVKLGVVAHACNPRLRKQSRQISEFKTSLIYTVSSGHGYVETDPCLKNKYPRLTFGPQTCTGIYIMNTYMRTHKNCIEVQCLGPTYPSAHKNDAVVWDDLFLHCEDKSHSGLIKN